MGSLVDLGGFHGFRVGSRGGSMGSLVDLGGSMAFVVDLEGIPWLLW